MAYDFQKLADVELLEEVPDGASAFVAVDGVVKRVPGSGLGGGGVATAILRFNSESNVSTNAVKKTASIPINKLPITCDNYTYAQARAMLESGGPFSAMLYYMDDGNIPTWMSCSQVAFSDNYIVMVFITDKGLAIYWNADGFFDREPVHYVS